MASTDISAYDWLCSTLKKTEYCDSSSGSGSVTDSESAVDDLATSDSYGTYGMKLTYYKVSSNLQRDKVFGEDQLRIIERAFYFDGYINSIPPNVRSYQVQGIWGEDVLTMYTSINAFKYYSGYGGSDRNTPNCYEQFAPRIGDIIYLEANDTLYEIYDVKYYNEAFGLQSHTYTLTLRVYKDLKFTIGENETLPKTDVIYSYASSSLASPYEIKDPLAINDDLTISTKMDAEQVKEHGNVNMYDMTYKPKESTEGENYVDPFGGW